MEPRLAERQRRADQAGDAVTQIAAQARLGDLEEQVRVHVREFDTPAEAAVHETRLPVEAQLAVDAIDDHVAGQRHNDVRRAHGVDECNHRTGHPVAREQRRVARLRQRVADADIQVRSVDGGVQSQRLVVARNEPPRLLSLAHGGDAEREIRDSELEIRERAEIRRHPRAGPVGEPDDSAQQRLRFAEPVREKLRRERTGSQLLGFEAHVGLEVGGDARRHRQSHHAEVVVQLGEEIRLVIIVRRDDLRAPVAADRLLHFAAQLLIAADDRFVRLLLCAIDLCGRNTRQRCRKFLLEEKRQLDRINIGITSQTAGFVIVDEQAGQLDSARQRETGIVGELEEQQLRLTSEHRHDELQ